MASDPEHRTSVHHVNRFQLDQMPTEARLRSRLLPYQRALCDCGWVGPIRPYMENITNEVCACVQLVSQDAASHLIASTHQTVTQAALL